MTNNFDDCHFPLWYYLYIYVCVCECVYNTYTYTKYHHAIEQQKGNYGCKLTFTYINVSQPIKMPHSDTYTLNNAKQTAIPTVGQTLVVDDEMVGYVQLVMRVSTDHSSLDFHLGHVKLLQTEDANMSTDRPTPAIGSTQQGTDIHCAGKVIPQTVNQRSPESYDISLGRSSAL